MKRSSLDEVKSLPVRPEYPTDAHLPIERRARVACDETACGAFERPDYESLEEMRAAYEHWAFHGLMGGCSHGW